MNSSFSLLACTEAGSDAERTLDKPMKLIHGDIQVIELQKKARETLFNIYCQLPFSNLFRNILLY